MRTLRQLRSIALSLLVIAFASSVAQVAQVADAAEPPAASAPAAAPARKVVIAPLTGLVDGGPDLAPAQALVGTGVGSVPGVVLISDKELRAALKKAKRKDLESCDGGVACLTELGKLVGAQIVVAGDVGDLGGGQVAYLMAVDVGSGRELGSTTAVLSGDAAQKQGEARAAAYRLLAPAAYVGTIALSTDIPGAVIYLDGKQVGKSPAAPVKTSVGTHALRVTHEQYRDYVRFIEVKFDETAKIDISLKEYPIVNDGMIENGGRLGGPIEERVAPRPWYRKGWAVAAMGTALLIATAITVAIVADGIAADREVIVGPEP